MVNSDTVAPVSPTDGRQCLGALTLLGNPKTMVRERRKASIAHKELLTSDYCPANGDFVSGGTFQTYLSAVQLQAEEAGGLFS